MAMKQTARSVSDMPQTIRVWLCDLTYTQQTIASDVMPAAVGCIATYLAKHSPSKPEIRVFKFPEVLAHALETEPPPHVIGFSNYIWNRELSAQFAATIKRHLPDVVTVMGGPNYPADKVERERFLRSHPMIDFYIVKEGEIAFTRLVGALEEVEFESDKVPPEIPSVHRIMPDGTFDSPDTIERILDLTEIPSPYLAGILDEFFDGRMLPIIQTNRGCPFRCTFCVEGVRYYSKVAKGTGNRARDELEYIGARMARLREKGPTRSDLFIADSNFGMYKEDIQVCEAIAEIQRKYDFPDYINVATGKNQKQRVLEAAKIIQGALRISGSVQSLDPEVLANIDRSNIDEREIIELALEASKIGANSYSEIILALPGDSLAAHIYTVRTVVEADFNTVALFQLMLLPGTDLASLESIKKWDMRTSYRVLPRCYGHFDVLGDAIACAEIEHICIGNSSLTVDEYLECRNLHLVVNLFYNDAVFKEALRLIKLLGLSKFDWLEQIWRHSDNEAFNSLVADFIAETKEELWEREEDLRAFVQSKETVERFIDGELGANLIFKYKTLGLVRHPDELAQVATDALVWYFKKSGCDEDATKLGCELIEFARQRMINLFDNYDETGRGTFEFDVVRFAQDVEPASVAAYRLEKPVELQFSMTESQKETVRNFIGIYGDTVIGLGRILSKVYVRKLYRIPEYTDPSMGQESMSMSARESSIGDRRLSGLNEFA